MAIPQIELGEGVVYNLDKLREETDVPIRVVCAALYAAIKPRISDEKEFKKRYVEVKEVVKDVATHGDEAYPRLVLVRQELGETILRTVNRKKPDLGYSEEEIADGLACNGYGGKILERYCEEDYSRSTRDEIVTSYLRIPHDDAGSRLLE